MAFTPKTQAQLRQLILDSLSAKYSAIGKAVSVVDGSNAYLRADAVALVYENVERRALELASEIFPDSASTEYLERHASLIGLARKPASGATLSVSVSGTPGTTSPVGARKLVAADGTQYAPVDSSGAPLVDITLDVFTGTATILAAATTTGAATNKPAGTVLTWTSAPTAFDSTGTVLAVDTTGTDVETDAALAARVLSWWRDRPGSGNRADWANWATTIPACSAAYVYPLLHYAYGVGTLGSVTVVCLGPPQGDSPINTRILGAGDLDDIEGYVDGTNDANGVATPNGNQLRPVTMNLTDASIETAIEAVQNVDATVVLAPAYAFEWTGTMTVDGTSGPSTLVVTGDQTAKNGKRALVNVGTSNVRGGYQQVTLGTGTFASGKTTWNVPNLAGTPSGTAYPGTTAWDALRLRAFGSFDALGPGDTSPAARWPSEDYGARATLYRAALAAALIDGTSVLSASVGTPAADVTPAAKALVTLGTLLIHA